MRKEDDKASVNRQKEEEDGVMRQEKDKMDWMKVGEAAEFTI